MNFKNMKLREMCFIALMAAVICVCAPFSINVGPVPISLCSFTVYLAGALLGMKKGTAAVLIYILLGAVGLPVFSNFGAGFSKIAGATGGFIIGYLPCAALTGLGADLIAKKRAGKWMYPVSMLIGTAVLYAMGTAWFMHVLTGKTLSAALSACVIPFLAGDAIKIALASLVGITAKERLVKAGIFRA